MIFGIPTSGLQLALRAGVAAGLSIAIAQFFKLEYPIYAFIAAVIVTDLNPTRSGQLGLIRLVATVVGALLGAALSAAFPPGPATVGVGIVLAMLACHLVRAPEGARVAGYICGLVVFEHASDPLHYAFFRFIETVLGVLIAWAVSYVPKLIRMEQPGR
jgi:uncharacterized membrane protein YgaE (UPF0421/DUF939 family)